jgi:hypothetical protein
MRRNLKWERITWAKAGTLIAMQPLIRMAGGVVIDNAIDKLDNGAGVYEAVRFTHSGGVEMAEGTLLDFQDCE